MGYQRLLPLLGLGLIVIGILGRGWWFLAVWFGGDFLLLGIAYARGAHVIFGKRPDGSLAWWGRLAFWPLLLYTITVWHILRLLSRELAHNQVTDNLVVGRRLLPGEVDGQYINYVDLTAEFSEPASIRQSVAYHSFPILDGSAPDPDAMLNALAGLRPGRTFIHCAQGHGRTGLFALAFLLKSGAVRTVEDGLQMLRTSRPGVRLNKTQRSCIDRFAANLRA